MIEKQDAPVIIAFFLSIISIILGLVLAIVYGIKYFNMNPKKSEYRKNEYFTTNLSKYLTISD